MPSMSAHMAIACRLSNKLDVDKDEFIKGNLLPDLYNDKLKSHFKILGKQYYIPNIEEALKKLDLNKSIDLGYLSHLLLDKYYFDNYLIKYNKDLFEDNEIYNDYDILNKDIIDYFKIDRNYLKEILKDFPKNINNKKLKKNLECLDLNISGNTKIINKRDFIAFLDNISIIIEDEIKYIIRRSNNGQIK